MDVPGASRSNRTATIYISRTHSPTALGGPVAHLYRHILILYNYYSMPRREVGSCMLLIPSSRSWCGADASDGNSVGLHCLALIAIASQQDLDHARQ